VDYYIKYCSLFWLRTGARKPTLEVGSVGRLVLLDCWTAWVVEGRGGGSSDRGRSSLGSRDPIFLACFCHGALAKPF